VEEEMTPQQLIDMRGAGNAEKWLRKNGKWLLTPEEEIIKQMRHAQDMLSSAIEVMEGRS
jgi:hypothetical protein